MYSRHIPTGSTIKKIRADLNQKIYFCLRAAGYPPQYNQEVFDQVMEQVEHFKEYGGE